MNSCSFRQPCSSCVNFGTEVYQLSPSGTPETGVWWLLLRTLQAPTGFMWLVLTLVTALFVVLQLLVQLQRESP
ncbi:hypothetical protein V5799_000479 [Amblyomma americanum]|uniref:Uncharacterized protein n=1 Tax=Amblyomma americanum TaxID=6943 RepID=A0AAQ4D2X3_AMBAM